MTSARDDEFTMPEGEITPSLKKEKRNWLSPKLTNVGAIRSFVQNGASKSGLGTDGHSQEPKKNKALGWDDEGSFGDDW